MRNKKEKEIEEIEEIENPELENQLLENEQKTNKVISYVSLVFVCILTAVQVMLRNNYSSEMINMKGYILGSVCIVIIIGFFITRYKHYSGEGIKYVQVYSIILMSVGLFLIYPTYMCYLIFFPLLISARYYDKKFTIEVTSVTFILFLLACQFNIVFDDKLSVIQALHEGQALNLWEDPGKVVLHIVAPLTTTFAFSSWFILTESNDGYKLLEAQAENARRVASIETELSTASQIQQSVLPFGAYTVPNGNFILGAKEVPAKEVGGDFYDYFMVNDNVLAFLIADVSDKGLPAAMFMMSAKKAIQSALTCVQDLDEAAELINKLVCQDNKSGMFLTLWLGLLDTRSGVGRYINAGHCPPLIKHSNGDITLIENEPDLFLGNFPEISPAVHTFHVNEDENIILYTDGVTDAQNIKNESFGIDNLKKILSADERTNTFVRQIMNALEDYTQGKEQFDDETVFEIYCIELDKTEKISIHTNSGTDGTTEIIDAVDSRLKKAGCPEERRRNICTAVDEICANISEYAYDGAEGKMDADITLGANYIDISFSDEGIEFDPLQHEDPDISGEPKIGGLGIFLVREIADDISYKRENDRNVQSIRAIWGL